MEQEKLSAYEERAVGIILQGERFTDWEMGDLVKEMLDPIDDRKEAQDTVLDFSNRIRRRTLKDYPPNKLFKLKKVVDDFTEELRLYNVPFSVHALAKTPERLQHWATSAAAAGDKLTPDFAKKMLAAARHTGTSDQAETQTETEIGGHKPEATQTEEEVALARQKLAATVAGAQLTASSTTFLRAADKAKKAYSGELIDMIEKGLVSPKLLDIFAKEMQQAIASASHTLQLMLNKLAEVEQKKADKAA
jgi:hypothetical protein